MKSHLFISLGLSVFIHFTALAAVSTVQLLYQPKKKNVKILYVNPVKLSEIRQLELKEPDVSQPVPDDQQPAPVPQPPETQENIVINEEPKPEIDTPEPQATSTPAPPAPRTPANNQVAEKPPETEQDPEAKAEAEKIRILRRQPYFKDWPEERLKKLDLPPGMKNWDEAVAMTDYLDNEYNWTEIPPELGGDSKVSRPVPVPTSSPVIWKETEKDPVTEKYEVSFYVENVGFVSLVDEKYQNVVITYFPFEPDTETDSNTPSEVKIPEVTDIKLGFINIQWREIYRDDKEALIDEILNQYKIIQEEKAAVENR